MKDIAEAVRFLLINEKDQFLFFKMLPSCPSHGSHFWLSPGGKIEADEDLHAAAVRELFEETGLTEKEVDFGPIVCHAQADLKFKNKSYSLMQKIMVARTKTDTISFANLTENEKGYIKGYRWFSVDDIKASNEEFRPKGIEQHLPPLLKENYPEEPYIIETRTYLC